MKDWIFWENQWYLDDHESQSHFGWNFFHRLLLWWGKVFILIVQYWTMFCQLDSLHLEVCIMAVNYIKGPAGRALSHKPWDELIQAMITWSLNRQVSDMYGGACRPNTHNSSTHGQMTNTSHQHMNTSNTSPSTHLYMEMETKCKPSIHGRDF